MKTIFCIRYMWKIKGDNSIRFKIVTDLAEGLQAFEDSIMALQDLEAFSREYLSEYDCERLGVVDKLYHSVEKEVE